MTNAQNKKHCIIIHWCPSDDTDPTYNKHWMPWVKKSLEDQNFRVDTPAMPNPRLPVYEDYKEVFDQLEVNEDTVLVWHSCWCAFLVRWLWESKQKVQKLILVAPWKVNDEWDDYREKFYTFDIDKTISDRVSEIVMFTADNEDQDGKDSLKMYHHILWWEIIDIASYGHYTIGGMWTEDFPELISILVGS